MLVLKPLQEEFKKEPVIAMCIHDDSAHLGERHREPQAAGLVCKMMTRTMQLGRENLPLKYGEAKKQPSQSKRTADQVSVDSDVNVIWLQHEGIKILPAGVNRDHWHLKFAGIFIGDPDKVSVALSRKRSGWTTLKADKPYGSIDHFSTRP
jgi:hypothetical protein